MANNIKLIVYPAKDLEKTKSFYSKFLGVEPYVDGPYYVGYKLDNLEVGLDPNGQAVTGYIDVTDIMSSLQTLVDAGAVIQQDIKDVGGGMLIAQIKDANDNILGLSSHRNSLNNVCRNSNVQNARSKINRYKRTWLA
jgi:predicted enzyme related to lactoylglutathione lyase